MAKTWQDVLHAQEGVITRAQALAGGLSARAWEGKLARDWQRLLPGVAVVHTGPPTDRERAWAAVLYGGEGAALSGDAALVLQGMKLTSTGALDLAVPGQRRVVPQQPPNAPPVVVRRVKGLDRWRWDVRGLSLARPHAAVVHAAAWAVSDRVAEERVAAAVQQRKTAPVRVREVLEEMPTLHRRGLLLTVLDDVELGAHAGSELQYLRFCRQHGLPRPDELQVRVRVGKVHYLDARYRRQRVTVELDGAHHRSVGQWEADALRTLRVQAGMPGEQLVRLTPGLLRHDGDEVARLLHVLLD